MAQAASRCRSHPRPAVRSGTQTYPLSRLSSASFCPTSQQDLIYYLFCDKAFMTNHRRLPTRWLPCHRSGTATGASGKQREAARSGDRPPVGLQSHQYTAAHKLLSNHRTPLDHFDTAPGAGISADGRQARMSCRTRPCTSVSRKSRPPERYVRAS